MYAATPGEDGADDDADRAQERRRHRDLAQAAPRRLQAALVEDQREPDHADLRGRASRRRTRSRRARPSRAASRSPGRPRARATPFARHRGRRRCCPPGCRRRAEAEGPRPRSSIFRHGGTSRAAGAWNTSGMATRPAHAQDRPALGDRAGRRPARLRLLLRAAQAHRHPSVDGAGRGGRRGGRRLGARPAPARDARRARPDVRQVRPAALDPARRRPAGHRRRAARAPGRRQPVPVRAGARGGRKRARPDARAGVHRVRTRRRSQPRRSARCTGRCSRTATRSSSRCSGRTRRVRSRTTSRCSTRPPA